MHSNVHMQDTLDGKEEGSAVVVDSVAQKSSYSISILLAFRVSAGGTGISIKGDGVRSSRLVVRYAVKFYCSSQPQGPPAGLKLRVPSSGKAALPPAPYSYFALPP
jgi:hypothetical protein